MVTKVVIETPKGSKKKYELTKRGKLRLDRVLRPGFAFPGNYGFFPETLSGDGDALDVLVLGRSAVKPKSVLKVKIIGVMRMLDGGEKDDKVIAVGARAKTRRLKKMEIDKIEYFFKYYKRRKIEIKGFEGVEKAKKTITQAKKRYKRKK